MSKCFMVYPIPFIADESFLNLMFDGGVRRSVFAGFGARRFALVEVRDGFFAENVLRALQPNACANKTGETAEDDMTLAELFNEPSAPSIGGGLAHIGHIRFRGRPVCVVPSPLELEEIFHCGGRVQPCGANRKRPRPNAETINPTEETTNPTEETTNSTERETSPTAPPSKRGGGEACKKCGSTSHFTRHCDGGNSSHHNHNHTAPPATRLATIPAATEAGSEGVAMPEGEVESTPKRTAATAQVVRRSKDDCKHCGSAQHLSRHCPSK